MPPRSTHAPRQKPLRVRGDEPYAVLSTRPLHVLCCLLPLIVLYEVGSLMYLEDHGRGIVETIGARSILTRFFETFGGATFYLPGITLGLVLLLWHLFTRDRWVVRPGVILAMFAEAALWTLPLLVLGLVVFHGAGAAGASTSEVQTLSNPGLHLPAAIAAPDTTLGSLPWQARLTLSVGAGIYEELLFRLILVTLIHFVVVDLARLPSMTGNVAAAIASGLGFALYHDLASAAGGTDWRLFAFYTVAGTYFASLYLVRGFGIVVACHACYDVLVLVVIASR